MQEFEEWTPSQNQTKERTKFLSLCVIFLLAALCFLIAALLISRNQADILIQVQENTANSMQTTEN